MLGLNTSCSPIRPEGASLKSQKYTTRPTTPLWEEGPRVFYVEEHPNRSLANYKSYAVGIGYPEDSKPFCSGLLVTYAIRNYVLTAAHCLKKGDLRPIAIFPYYEKAESIERRKLRFPILKAAFIDQRIDLGLALVDLPPGIVALPWIVGEAIPGDALFGIGQPAGDFKTISDQCSVQTVGSPYIFTHDCKMISGSSGTAMLSVSTHRIIGVMSSGAVTLDINHDGEIKRAVNLYPQLHLVEAVLRGEDNILGYSLDGISAAYHFLLFKGQMHCPRKANPVCEQKLKEILPIIMQPRYLAALKKAFPSEMNQFNGYADSDFGILIRLLDIGEHKVEKKMIDFVFTSGDDFSTILERWLALVE